MNATLICADITPIHVKHVHTVRRFMWTRTIPFTAISVQAVECERCTWNWTSRTVTPCHAHRKENSHAQ